MIRKSEYEIQKDLKNLETDLDDLSTTVASKTEVNDDVSDSVDTTYSASKIEELIADIPSGGEVEGTAVLSTGETGGTKFLREDGDGTCSWQTPSGSSPTVATGAEVDTGTDNTKMVTPKAMEDSSYAKTAAIPVKASTSEVNAGTDYAKFVTSYALNGSNYLNDTKAINLTDIADSEIDLDNHSLILIDTGDSTIKKITFANLKKYLDTLYTPL